MHFDFTIEAIQRSDAEVHQYHRRPVRDLSISGQRVTLDLVLQVSVDLLRARSLCGGTAFLYPAV
jgi:hypothetical protein